MSLTRLKAIPPDYAEQLRRDREALETLRARRAAGELTTRELEDALVELVLARVATLPAPLVADLRRVLREGLDSDPYLLELRAALGAEASREG
ncbi:MAG: hypothetical protein K8H88_20040 [Sandaracinaceae bacterium]|nr:hypothetical protein [Sandaracinaceae bacterium]